MDPLIKKNDYLDDVVIEEQKEDLFTVELSERALVQTSNDRPKKVLFVSSGNLKNFDLAPFIKVQGDSLAEVGIQVTYFKIKGKGFLGYIRNIRNLRRIIKQYDFDLIHAHFTLSAWVAVLTFPKTPLVLSLMGTDALGRIKNSWKIPLVSNYLTTLTYLIQPFVTTIISKSPNIDKYVWLKKKSYILPNGVDFIKFDGKRTDFKRELGLSYNKKHILFLGSTQDTNKNFKLLQSCKDELQLKGFEIIAPYPVNHEKIVKYLSSVDQLVMCSLQEGSPNVVKEAMASNCKGVFTNVGDVQKLVNNTPGYAITENNKDDLIKKILMVDKMSTCEGRKKLQSLGLDTKSVANKLKNIYIKSL
ncbi:glycosyltransferase [Echinicola sp. CAU 1574]|uniref:Glycosyltransferase n=1 Tax=Echinicola arenosa TaxID=2774144 RepID=A0ABR9ANW3_9BACT|nr:glycosyltransferase [Echinicola arenosa]MBD8490478.1 glycosyltransferase [Echinicola arenosa]